MKESALNARFTSNRKRRMEMERKDRVREDEASYFLLLLHQQPFVFVHSHRRINEKNQETREATNRTENIRHKRMNQHQRKDRLN